MPSRVLEKRVSEPNAVLSRPPRQGTSELLHAPPSPALAEHVAHFWSVRWDFQQPFLAHTLPHPVVHIIFELGEGLIYGLSRKPFRRELIGKDRVFAVKFRPAGFAPFFSPLSALTERRLDFGSFFRAQRLQRQLLKIDDFHDCVSLLQSFLEKRLKPMTREMLDARDLVERIERDRSIQRVEQLGSPRTLQRLFARCVGLPPKWVIGRYRLHEAAGRLKSGDKIDLAALAYELGYFDQAHFIRDFRRHVGEPPGAFFKGRR
jgi:AraC-like DNA-binding protein